MMRKGCTTKILLHIKTQLFYLLLQWFTKKKWTNLWNHFSQSRTVGWAKKKSDAALSHLKLCWPLFLMFGTINYIIITIINILISSESNQLALLHNKTLFQQVQTVVIVKMTLSWSTLWCLALQVWSLQSNSLPTRSTCLWEHLKSSDDLQLGGEWGGEGRS